MARHGIDEALLAEDADRPRRVVNRRLTMPAPYARDKATLAASIAMALRCKAILLTRGKSVVLQIFGFESDVRHVDALFSSLLVQAAHELAITPIPAPEHPAAFRRSWWVGFAVAVNARLQQANRAAEAQAEEITTTHLRQPERRSRAGPPSRRDRRGCRRGLSESAAGASAPPERWRARQGYRSGQRVDMGLSANIAAH